MAARFLVDTCRQMRGQSAFVSSFGSLPELDSQIFGVAVQLGSWQSYHIVLQLKAETFSATMCLFPRTTTSSIPAVYIDPVKWPRQQVGEDFQAIAQRYGAMNLVVHVPSIDPKYKIALLLSKQDHCLVEMLNRWQDGKLPVPGAEGNFVFIMHSTRNQRKLRLLPEAFGRIQGLLVLDLSNNQLQITSCSFCNHNLLTLLRKGIEALMSESHDYP
ncbi:hypothetical protein Bca52824_036005 [Brassica carinata]|uniref:Uncharacterized protein n=1 Tax=Brassica carinata TaxID=52824 RepID=A0A8X7S4G1_BRACI|nr:hypothetical protein Bca52824_036005 [Brassica carinata]